MNPKIADSAPSGPVTLLEMIRELRYFADRSYYDALATVYHIRGTSLRRFTRDYDLASANLAEAKSTPLFEYLPDADESGLRSEDVGFAIITNLMAPLGYVALDTTSRDTMMLGKMTDVLVYDSGLDTPAEQRSEFTPMLVVNIQPRNEAAAMTVSAMGTEESIFDLNRTLMQNMTLMVNRSVTSIDMNPDGSIVQTTRALSKPEKYLCQVYPHVRLSPKDFYDAWTASGMPVSILFGPAGTGKSSYVTQMLHHRGFKNVYFADNVDVMLNPGFVRMLREVPDGSIVILEDADNFLLKRTDGNRAMSSLPGITSGTVEKDIQIMILTNLPTLSKVDEALMRKGRLYKSVHFPPIEASMVNTVRTSLNKPHLTDEQLEERKAWTLADIVYFDPDEAAESVASPQFGFHTA